MREHPRGARLRAALERHRDAVLQAPTGAGKSTIVPLALLHEPFMAGRKIIMLEPRRLATRAVAARMASLLGEPLGATVGYRMRLDTRVGAATRIEVVTEGVLTRMLQEDPSLEDVACLIFDEYHERSLQADLGLALALDAREQLDASFRILIMSATLEIEPVVALLGDAARVSATGRAFAVDIRYLGRGPALLAAPSSSAAPAASFPQSMLAIARAARLALGQSSDDVLVFLPGAAEIRAVHRLLAESELPAGVRVLALHGQMSAHAQDAVLSPATAAARKVVLATNVAETGLTIPGVTAVVDSGLVRRARFDPVSGMSRLTLTRISRAASEQRAGRAGRVAPGICYRLWSEGAQASLAATTRAEILEADLAPLALELARWGITDVQRLRWLDAPPAAALEQARGLLVELEALQADGRITPRGLQMNTLPVHPRLAHMLLRAHELGQLVLASELAALLSERDLLRPGSDSLGGAEAPTGGNARSRERDPDIRSRLELLQRGSLSASAGAETAEGRLRRGAQHLQRAVLVLGKPKAAAVLDVAASYLPGALLALAFPDRIGQRRTGSEGRYLLANGRGAAFAGPSSLAREPLLVALELDDAQREARIDLAAPLSYAALENILATRISTEEAFGWDEEAGALLARRVRRFDALVLEDRLLPLAAENERVLPAMLEVLQRLGIGALPWDAETRNLRARMQFVQALARPDLPDWPASDDATLLASLAQWLGPYLHGITNRAALTRLPLREALLARLRSAQRRALEALAPRELVVPSGSAIRIDYLSDNAPCLSVRLQEVFGLAEVPRIGQGAVPVTLQLLSPAHRPVQITRDLAGFWGGSYAEVRRDMRARYPKHYWPDNPLEAAPMRGTRAATHRQARR